MELILREDIEKLGQRGQLVKVTAGYARNYLLPRKLAVTANESNKKIVEQEKQAYLRRESKEIGDANDLAKMMGSVEVTIAQKLVSTSGTDTSSPEYTITTVSTATGWQVQNIQLASLGNQ